MAANSCAVDISRRSSKSSINFADILEKVLLFEEAASKAPDAPIWHNCADEQIDDISRHLPSDATQRIRRFEETLKVCQEATADGLKVYTHYKVDTIKDFKLALNFVRRFTEILRACQDVASIFQETGERKDERSALTKLANALQEICRLGDALIAFEDA